MEIYLSVSTSIPMDPSLTLPSLSPAPFEGVDCGGTEVRSKLKRSLAKLLLKRREASEQRENSGGERREAWLLLLRFIWAKCQSTGDQTVATHSVGQRAKLQLGGTEWMDGATGEQDFKGACKDAICSVGRQFNWVSNVNGLSTAGSLALTWAATSP